MRTIIGKILSIILILAMMLSVGFLPIWNPETAAGAAAPTRYSGISFYQVDYEWNGSLFLNSDVGKIEVEVETLKRETGLESGYINGYTRQGWVIQNLVIIEDYAYETTSTLFDLGSSGEIREIWIYIEVTADPCDSFSGGALVDYTVFDAVYNAAGADDEPPIIQGTPAPPKGNFIYPEFDIFGVSFEHSQPDHPNVQAARYQCVPAAYANNLQYLENRYQIPISHELEPGWNQLLIGAFPDTSLPAQLDVVMNRGPVISPYQQDGTNCSDAVNGLLAYTYMIDPIIKIRHQGYHGDSDYELFGHKSYHQGTTIEFDFILSEMQKGHAVTLLFWRYEDGTKTTGHMVQLVSAGYILGVPFIEWRHDGTQADPVSDPDFTQGLEDCTRYLVDIDDDGYLNVLNDPLECPDKMPEVALIVTIEALNAPPEKPSTPSGEVDVIYSLLYEYTSSTTDPDGDKIKYKFYWGDGTNTGWLGLYDSGETVSASHNWFFLGDRIIRVKARDIWGAESELSDPLIVHVEPNLPAVFENLEELLEDAKMGLKIVDNTIDKAIEKMWKSLDDKFWLDESHLDPQHGMKFYDYVKMAVKELEKLLSSNRIPDSVKEVCQGVIDTLIGIVGSITTIAYEEALALDDAIGDDPWDNELEKSENAFGKGESELAMDNYSKAIDHYRKAWKEATKALRLMR